ncbi:MAG: hypothetical protein HUJ80_09790 [Firmicutes bacterium]|nr:hypothetical protein [Bacillota bacterium]
MSISAKSNTTHMAMTKGAMPCFVMGAMRAMYMCMCGMCIMEMSKINI